MFVILHVSSHRLRNKINKESIFISNEQIVLVPRNSHKNEKCAKILQRIFEMIILK